jgi:superfamily II DNA or RNA helicase
MDWTFGRRLLEIDARTLFARGWLTPPSVERVASDFRFEYTMPTTPGPKDQVKRMAKLQRAIVNDAARNELVVRRAVAEWKAGETVVILSNHKAHCRALGRLCWENGAEAMVLVAKGTKAAKQGRKDAIQAMREGKLRLVIATSLLDEGVDVERLSRIVLALPESTKRGTTQRLGRLMRNWPDKKPKLIDIVDPHVDTLVHRAQGRARVYKELGLEH